MKNNTNKKSMNEESGRMSKAKEKFLKLYAKNMGTVSLTCQQAGISRTTFYKWRNTTPSFAQQLEEIEDEQVDYAESKLKVNISNGDQRAIEYFLDRKGKKLGYGPKDSSINISNTQKVEQKAIIKIGMRQTDREKELLKGKKKPK